MLRGKVGARCAKIWGWRRLSGRGERRRRGHLDSDVSAPAMNAYIHRHTRYTHSPFHFAVKTPPYTQTPPKNFQPNKKRQPKPASPPYQPITLCRLRPHFRYCHYGHYYLQPPFLLFQGVLPSRPNRTLLPQQLHIGHPTHQQA